MGVSAPILWRARAELEAAALDGVVAVPSEGLGTGDVDLPVCGATVANAVDGDPVEVGFGVHVGAARAAGRHDLGSASEREAAGLVVSISVIYGAGLVVGNAAVAGDVAI